MSRMYESLMEGFLEDLHDIQKHGEPQGKKDVERIAVVLMKDWYFVLSDWNCRQVCFHLR